MTSNQKLVVKTVSQNSTTYEDSLRLIVDALGSVADGSLVVAPELVLSGFDYDDMQKASEFTLYAIERLKALVGNKLLILTTITQKDGLLYNEAVAITNHEVVHRQSKSRLFRLGDEHKYFESGNIEDVRIFEVDGIKYAILICFEIRFKELWKLVEGADVVVIPAQWGVLRESHIVTLCKALAIMNQCFVVLNSSGKEGILELSQIYNPNGDIAPLDKPIELNEIAKMRRYIDMGN